MSVSSKRRAGGAVRQLSLQQSQAGRRTLRKQSSEDGLGLRVLGEAPSVVRPRPPAHPVRLAWSERRQLSCEEPSQPASVGVVVQRVRGLPRPVTAKPARNTAPPPSILYSRQQLAERLRLAWRDRQQRPNLDIFLAHNSIDKVDDEPLLSVREIITQVEKNSLRTSEETPRNKYLLSDTLDTPSESFASNLFTNPEDERFNIQTFSSSSGKECMDSGEETAIDIHTTKLKLTPSIKISFDHVEDREREDNSSQQQTFVDLHLLSPDSCSHEEVSDRQNTDKQVEEELGDRNVKIKEPDKPKQDTLTATMRRANFRNSSNSPVMSGSMGSAPSLPPATQPAKPILKKPSTQPLTRMMSAPAIGRSAPSRGDMGKSNEIVEFDDEDDMTIVQRERNIKSAPARRRFKNMRRKGHKSHEDDSSEGEALEEAQVSLPSKIRARKRMVERTADIVTMVSLLSPTESEVEDTPPVIQLSQEPLALPPQEVETRPTTTTTPTTASTASSIVCLRKFATKTVSFQHGARNYTASYPSRRGVGTPLILPPPEPPAPPPLSTAPPPPLTLNRRRLVRPKSAGVICQEISCDSEPVLSLGDGELDPPAVSSSTQPVTITSPLGSTDPETDGDPTTEPDFKTDKERECWQMFRKMADKGVSVSYDTVLRGMLTPTEYRLHKKSMSSTC